MVLERIWGQTSRVRGVTMYGVEEEELNSVGWQDHRVGRAWFGREGDWRPEWPPMRAPLLLVLVPLRRRLRGLIMTSSSSSESPFSSSATSPWQTSDSRPGEGGGILAV